MKKKSISLLLILTLIMTCMGFGSLQAFAATPQISIANAKAQPGDRVDLTIKLTDNPGITSLDFSIEYDETQFELTGKQNGKLLGGTINSQTLDKVPYYCGWINSLQTKNCTDDGILITLTFKVKDGAVNGRQIIAFTQKEVTAYDAKIQSVKFAVENGYIEITNGKEPASQDKPSGGNTGTGTSTGGSTGQPGNSSEPTEPQEPDKPDTDNPQDGKPELTAAQKKTAAKVENMKITLSAAKYNKSKHTVTLKFKKSNKSYRVDGYQIYRSSKKSSGFKKVGTTAKTTWVDKKPGKRGATRYYKVRGYRKIAGKTYYTKWSAKQKLALG